MVSVHVRMGGVDDLRTERAHLLLDDAVHVDVRKRVEAHVGEVQVEVVRDAERGGGALRLLVLALAPLRIAGVLRRAAVGQADDPNLVAPDGGVERDRPAHAEDLVIGVGGEDEDSHPSRAPTVSGPAAVSISSRRRAPSPHATTGPSVSSPTIVPPGASTSIASGRARQTMTFSSPR